MFRAIGDIWWSVGSDTAPFSRHLNSLHRQTLLLPLYLSLLLFRSSIFFSFLFTGPAVALLIIPKDTVYRHSEVKPKEHDLGHNLAGVSFVVSLPLLNLVQCWLGAGAVAAVIPLPNAIGIGWVSVLVAGIWLVASPFCSSLRNAASRKWRRRGG
jgi:hypothetical protein